MVKPSSSSSRRAASNNGRSPAVSRRQARPESESEAEAGEGENGVEENDDGDNTIRILIATDNHLGYAEKDPVRGEDSLRAFEEILGLAQTEKVDMLLLGGDLFHDNKPSRKTIYETMALFREYCMGDAPSALEILSDQATHFQDRFSTANYLDPNLNVSIPVFSIHGNHDDPTGDGHYCSLDLMSVAGFVNYFGKCSDVDNITVSPILLQKGNTKLGLYGLGNIRDERLHRTFKHKRVKMLRPRQDADDWFNLMVIHQNRSQHGPKNYIPDSFLSDFLHLILWGHEHECRIDPEPSMVQDFQITQPGSSIATSLCEGESVDKHVGILSITGKKFNLKKIPLKSVRPFVMDEVELKSVEGLSPSDEKAVAEFLSDQVDDLIKRAFNNWKSLNKDLSDDAFPKPLIRLKVEYSGGFTTYNPQRFGQRFVDKVANPKDILHFYRRKTASATSIKVRAAAAESLAAVAAFPPQLDGVKVEDLVAEYLSAQSLEILPENELTDTVILSVEKQEKDLIQKFIERTINRTTNILNEKEQLPKDSDNMKKEISEIKLTLAKEFDDQVGGQPSAYKKPSFSKKKKTESDEMDVDDDDDEDGDNDEDEEEVALPTTSKSRGGTKAKPKPAASSSKGKGKAKASSATVSKKKKAATVDDDDEEEGDTLLRGTDDDGNESVELTDGGGSTRGRAGVSSSTRKRPIVTADEGDDDVVEIINPAPKKRAAAVGSSSSSSRSSKPTTAAATKKVSSAASAAKTSSSSSSLKQSKLSFSAHPKPSVAAADDEEDDFEKSFAF